MTEDPGFVIDVLREFARADAHDELYWRTDGLYVPVTFFAMCSDVFNWATADCERITTQNLPELRRAIDDLTPLGRTQASMWFATLFAARVRGRRPQPALYRRMTPEVAALFDACGPPRDEERRS